MFLKGCLFLLDIWFSIFSSLGLTGLLSLAFPTREAKRMSAHLFQWFLNGCVPEMHA
jgi:hypothetical protein